MKYFCSYSYICGNTPYFGNCTLESTVDPYDNIEKFHNDLVKQVNEKMTVLLFYKKVKS